MIQGLQIRLDRPLKKEGDPPDKGGAKYLWLASTSKTFGVSSGSPVHFVGDPCSRVVYVTEGALKADIAHALTGRTFAATGGAGCAEDFGLLFRKVPRVSAGLAASIFHFGEVEIGALKRTLDENGINVRL